MTPKWTKKVIAESGKDSCVVAVIGYGLPAHGYFDSHASSCLLDSAGTGPVITGS